METNRKKWLIALGILVIVLIALCAVYRMYSKGWWVNSEYQAVFLTNGQVYFGKLSHAGSWLKLTDIYYLQATEPLQQGTEPVVPASNQIQLVKLGSELHGPHDEMFIDRDKILFWENLKEDSKVVQTIRESK